MRKMEPTTPHEFSYEIFEQKIGASFPEISQQVSAPRQRPGYVLVIAGLFLSGAIVIFAPKDIADFLLVPVLLAELAGVLWIFFALAVREYMSFKVQKRDFATELEIHFKDYQAIIEWLREYPPEVLANRLQYVRLRSDSMTQRLGILMGGIEKLGLLPIFAVLYIQFRDTELHWPLSINAIPAIIGGMLLSGYLAAFASMSLRLRLSLYERLIDEAIRRGSI